MIQDCIKMLSVIICGNERKNINITPDSDIDDVAGFIVQLFGKCEIDTEHSKAKLKPLKKLPHGTTLITVPHASKKVFMLIIGIITQLNLSVCFENITPELTPEEFKHISTVTQNQLQYIGYEGKLYFSSLLSDENPLFEECKIPELAAGLCLGAPLAHYRTQVRKFSPVRNKLVAFTLETMKEDGADIVYMKSIKDPVILSMRKKRLTLKTDKNK